MYPPVQPFTARQHMLKTQYEIYRYQDAYPRPVALHHHDFYEVYFFRSGRVRYLIESRIYPLKAGDILLISPQELHQPLFEEGEQPYDRVVLWLSGRCLEALSDSEADLANCFGARQGRRNNLVRLEAEERAQLDQVLEELLRESAGGQLGSELAARALLTQLLVWLNRRHRPAAEGPEQDLMERLTGYIQDHLCGPLSLDVLSRRFFVSKYHLSRLFRQRMGTSLYRYIIQRRLILAKQLLMKPLPAAEAYRQSGFGDYANFYRAFRAEYGLSPRQFQQEWRRAEESKKFD